MDGLGENREGEGGEGEGAREGGRGGGGRYILHIVKDLGQS